MQQLNPRSKLPLYHQLYEILKESILGGVFQPGEMIPAESELIERYGVSRTTVRQVLGILVNEGLVYRQRGRGSFVAHQTLEEGLSRIISFTEDMKRRGFNPETQVLFADVIPAPPQIADKLRITPGEELARIRRLRLADGEPICIEDSHLLYRLFPGIERADLSRSLEEETHAHGVRWSRAVQTIRAVQAEREVAKLLAVPAKSAVLLIERVSYTQDDQPAEFLRVHYRGDRYSLHTELQG
jgi:GntR family transcriptional regulator